MARKQRYRVRLIQLDETSDLWGFECGPKYHVFGREVTEVVVQGDEPPKSTTRERVEVTQLSDPEAREHRFKKLTVTTPRHKAN